MFCQTWLQRKLVALVLILLTAAGPNMIPPFQAKPRVNLAPWHESPKMLESRPLTLAELRQAAQSGNPDVRELARVVLSEQKISKTGILFCFIAAFFASFSPIGQEIVLKKIQIVDFLFLQPLVMAAIYLGVILFKMRTQIPAISKKFFSLLWKTGNVHWFLLTWFSHQIVRNALFFYCLPKIGSTGISMISATTVFFTPFFEWWILKKNKFGLGYSFSYLLIFIGVVGYKFTSLPGVLLFGLALLHYFLAAWENGQKRKINDDVGEYAKTDEFSLMLLISHYFLSFVTWVGLWAVLPFSATSFPDLRNVFQNSALFSLVVFASCFTLAAYRYFEQRIRTIPHFPVSVQESILQTRIILTALLVSLISGMATRFLFFAQHKFVLPTLSQWLIWLPIIFTGVLLISHVQQKEEKKRNGNGNGNNKATGPRGEKITRADWDRMLRMMAETSAAIPDAAKRAKAVWKNRFSAQVALEALEPAVLQERGDVDLGAAEPFVRDAFHLASKTAREVAVKLKADWENLKEWNRLRRHVAELEKRKSNFARDEEIARAKRVLKGIEKNLPVIKMKTDHTFVTHSDLQAFETAMRLILEKFPDHYVMGEEDTALFGDQELVARNNRNRSSPFIWRIDPLDGTKTFFDSKETWSFVLSLWLKKEGKEYPIVSLVAAPITKEIWTARLGKAGVNFKHHHITAMPANNNPKAMRVRAHGSRSQRLLYPHTDLLKTTIGDVPTRGTGSIAIQTARTFIPKEYPERNDAVVSLILEDWDAGPLFLIWKAGGTVVDHRTGETIFPYVSRGNAGKRLEVIAGTPDAVAEIQRLFKMPSEIRWLEPALADEAV